MMNTLTLSDLSDGMPVTLAQMLEHRDRRFSVQQSLHQQYHLPLLSLTVVIPGEVKYSSGSRFLFAQAKQAVTELIAKQHWPIVDEYYHQSMCGEEQIWVIDGDAQAIKQNCVALEEQHNLGRLWDIDVFNHQLKSLSRQGHPRRCLLCDNDAHSCVRSRRHSSNDILNHIENRLVQFLHNK